MSFGSRFTGLCLTFVLPFFTALTIGFLCFSLGSRAGSNYQYSQDEDLLEICAQDVRGLKERLTEMNSGDPALQLDRPCERVCEAIEMASDGFVANTASFKASSGECVCFFKPDL